MEKEQREALALSAEDREALEAARKRPICFDEDCSETTPERALLFKRVNPRRSSMGKTTVSITVPKGMIPYAEDLDQEHDFARNAMILYPLIRKGVISQGRAAEILGVHKSELIDFYGAMEIHV